MGLLLDTHIFLWVVGNELAARDRRIADLLRGRADLHVSLATVWEIAIKRRLGKLDIGFDLADTQKVLTGMRLRLLDITLDHVTAELDPWPPTRDPFDRLLLAQCQTESLRLVTADRALFDHPLAARS